MEYTKGRASTVGMYPLITSLLNLNLNFWHDSQYFHTLNASSVRYTFVRVISSTLNSLLALVSAIAAIGTHLDKIYCIFKVFLEG